MPRAGPDVIDAAKEKDIGGIYIYMDVVREDMEDSLRWMTFFLNCFFTSFFAELLLVQVFSFHVNLNASFRELEINKEQKPSINF